MVVAVVGMLLSEACALGGPEGQPISQPRTDKALTTVDGPVRSLTEWYKKQMEWEGVPSGESVFEREPIGMVGEPAFKGVDDGELMRLMKAAYPASAQIDLVQRRMLPSRYGDRTNWTGEVEFRLTDAASQARKVFLNWPVRCVLTNGSTILSGLVLPGLNGYGDYLRASEERIIKKETTESIFAIAGLDAGGKEVEFRDSVANDVYRITDDTGPIGTGFHFEPHQGLFRRVETREMRVQKMPADGEGAVVEEGWTRIYDLAARSLVLKVPMWFATRGAKPVSMGKEVQWRDVDGDEAAEVIIKDSDDSAYIYKWRGGTYAYWKHDSIPPDPKPYNPGAVNPRVRVTIVVKDVAGRPVEGCEIGASITTKHPNVLKLWDEPKAKDSWVLMKTDANGQAALDERASSVMLKFAKKGYASKEVLLRAYAEPIPDVLPVTLDATP